MYYNKLTEEKRQQDLNKIKHICCCSCRVYIPAYVDSVICKWCGRRIYRTPQIEFRAKVKQAVRMTKANENM